MGIGQEDQRIVDRGVGLRFKYAAAMRQRVAHRAVDLRDAAQRVSVLHAAAVAMRFANLAAFQHAPQVGCGLYLSGMRTRLVNALVKSGVGALERVAAQAAQHVGGIDQRFGCQQRQSSNRQHGLGSVDQRNGFFGLEHQRLDLGAFQGFGARDAQAFFIEAFAFADQRQGQDEPAEPDRRSPLRCLATAPPG